MRAKWRIMLDGATEEALLAVDLYNQPRQPRRLEGFFVHMHLAWLYLLHAEFRRDGADYHYRQPNGWFVRVDGEPKTWDLQTSAAYRWPNGGPVRTNLELTIALRNKIEHRYHAAIAVATSGYAQALLLNFEDELTAAFGPKASLGEKLRFPIFVGELTALGDARIQDLRGELPKNTRDFLARFESDLDPAITQDQRYEFRITLVPKLGPKTEADRSLTFVREGDLSDNEKAMLTELGKSGSVVVREQTRPVASAGLMRPAIAAARVQARIPFVFHMGHFIRAWKALGCRPPGGAKRPERTDEKYCVYDEPHGDYLYTPAFVDRVARETSTAKKFEDFIGLPAKPKPDEENLASQA
jgi:Domain of unknown function (DUF3644)